MVGILLSEEIFRLEMGLLNRRFGIGFQPPECERRIPHLSSQPL